MDLMLHVTYHLSPSWNAGENGSAADDQGAVGHGAVSRLRGRDASRATSVPGNKGCVLVVDDDSAVRETLAELLDDVGFRALQAGDAAQALTILRQGETIDVLVTDLTMPGDDGISLIRQARSIRNNLPAILLTGYAEQVTAISTIAGGNFHVLRKPVQSGRLIQHIELLVTKSEG